MTPATESISSDDVRYRQFLAALLEGDRQQAREIFEGWLYEDRPIRWLYQGILQRALYEVGARWESGSISVATEHLATAIVDSLLNLVYPRLFRRPSTGRSVVVTCSVNEHHQIGAKMVADIFEMHGWRSYFLGANTPLEDLLKLINEKRPTATAFSLTLYFNIDALIGALTRVRESHPTLPLLVGGQAFHWGGQERITRIPGVLMPAKLEDLEAWIDAHCR